MQQLTLNKQTFASFLDANSKINDAFILKLQKPIYAISVSEDNTLFLYSKYVTDTDILSRLNIPDCRKLARAIDSINETEITLQIHPNHLYYQGNGIKFKYHLLEDGILSEPPLNTEKIEAFRFNYNIDISKSTFASLIKCSSFATTTNKIYFYTENNNFYVELTDKTIKNTDSITTCIKENVDFNIEPLAVNFDNLRLINVISDTISLSFNTQYGIIMLSSETEDIKLNYILTTLIN